MRLDNLLEKRWSRNATLVQGLATLDIMEEIGFGLDRMVAEMAAEGLPPPRFADNRDSFVVTLYGHRHTLVTPVPEQNGGRAAARPVVGASLARTAAERQAWALDHLRMVGPLSPHAYAAALGVSIDTAKRDLRALVAQGRVRAEGATRDRRYILAE